MESEKRKKWKRIHESMEIIKGKEMETDPRKHGDEKKRNGNGSMKAWRRKGERNGNGSTKAWRRKEKEMETDP